VAPPNYARVERAACCDTLAALGPDEPTLCTGWTTRDLAAHLIVRERRPDAAAGITLRFLAGHTAKVQSAMAGRPFDELVALVREPPRWSPLAGVPAIDRAANTMEFFIHTEDARRGQPAWEPRPLTGGLGAALWARVPGAARFGTGLRRFPAAVALVAPGYGQARAGAGGPELTVTGDPGELAMFVSGRQRAARVEVTGPAELVDRLRDAKLGS
jgi:uncharacterized protein (TIGR03085 family)